MLFEFRRLRKVLASTFGRNKAITLDRSVGIEQSFLRLKRKNLEIESFINIGAGHGDDIEFFMKYFPNMRSLFIDMDSRFLGTWKKLAQKYEGLQYVICGASSEDGVGRFLKSNDVGGALVPNSNTSKDFYETPLRRIDSLVAEHNLPGPYFLKFDTHGVELDILSGASTTLENTSLIMMEVYNFKLDFIDRKNLTFDEMSLHMKSLGFKCIDFCEPLFRPKDFAFWQMHMLFIRQDHPIWRRGCYSAL